MVCEKKIEPFLEKKTDSQENSLPIKGTEVLISGGGPAGMIAAIHLSKLGIPNVIVERRTEIQTHPKAHELSARSLEILASLGVPISKLLKEASDHETASRILFCNTINDEIGRIDLQEDSIQAKYSTHLELKFPYLNISQTEFEKVIREHIKSLKLTTVLLNHQWISAKEEDGKVYSDILDRETGNKFQFRSKYLICADGANSKARAQLGIQMQGPEKIQDVVNAYFTNDMSNYVKNKAKLYWILNPQAPGVFIAHHPKKRWVYHHPIETPYQKIETFDEEYLQEKMRIAMGLDKDFRFKIESISSWRMTAQIAEKFRKGNIFLIGDAAHRFPPTGGLGMNSGIGDAQNLCWKIASVLKGEALASLLDTYKSERKPILKSNCDESRSNYFAILDLLKALGLNPFLGQLMDRILNSIFVKWIPNRIRTNLSTAIRVKATQILIKNQNNPNKTKQIDEAIKKQIGHFDRIGLDLGYRYTSNDIHSEPQVTQYFPSTDIGVRFPHFWLSANKSSHTLLSVTHFTLLIDSKSNYKNQWRKLQNEYKNKFTFVVRVINLDSSQRLNKIELKSLLMRLCQVE